MSFDAFKLYRIKPVEVLTPFITLSVVRLPLIDGLVGFLLIAGIRLGLVVCHGNAGFVIEDHEHRKMVGADVRKSPQIDDKEML